jgi:hypothetical protein
VVSSDVFWSALPGMSLLERAGRMRARPAAVTGSPNWRPVRRRPAQPAGLSAGAGSAPKWQATMWLLPGRTGRGAGSSIRQISAARGQRG